VDLDEDALGRKREREREESAKECRLSMQFKLDGWFGCFSTYFVLLQSTLHCMYFDSVV
jgi:hypothetical protein